MLVCGVFLVSLALLVPSGAAYESKYDTIDLDEVLRNDRLRTNYVKCLLNEGACTPDAQELKTTLPDAIDSECAKCSERQRTGAEKVTHYLIDNKPAEWDQLSVIYDADGEYKRKYLEQKEQEQKLHEEMLEEDAEEKNKEEV